MHFQLNIYGSPWLSNSANDALAFAQAAMAAGHSIKRVFFFFDGVYHGLAAQSPASDEADLLRQWRTLADQQIPLLVCIAAGANRGVLNDEEAKRYEKSHSTCLDIFEVTGLGQWASGFHDCDRIITFK